VAAISIVGVVVRVLWRSRHLDVYFDSYGYLLVARALRHGQFLMDWGSGRQIPYHPPGYAAAILAVSGFAEPGASAPALASALLGSLAPPLAAVCSAALFGFPAAILTAAFWVLNPLHVAYSQQAMADATAVTVTLLGAALWLAGRGPLTAVLAGTVFGAAVLTRYSEVLSFIWLVVLAPHVANVTWRRKIFAVAAMALSLLPAALWQLTRVGLTSTTYGPIESVLKLSHAFEASNNPLMYRPNEGHLLAYLHFLGGGDGGAIWVPLCHSSLLLPLAFVPLVLGTSRDRLVSVWLLSWVVVHVSLISLMWVSEPRYMLPAYVPLAWLAGLGVEQLGRRSRLLSVAAACVLLLPPVWASRDKMFQVRPAGEYARLPDLIAACPPNAPIVTSIPMAVAVYDPPNARRTIDPLVVPVAEVPEIRSRQHCLIVEDHVKFNAQSWIDELCRIARCRTIRSAPGIDLQLVDPR